jgi:molybdopterin-guanine dinucleotide biosynthesis protein A
VPSKELLESIIDNLRHQKPQLLVALGQNDMAKVIELVDRVILEDALGVPEGDIAGLRAAREFLFQRRRARGRKSHGTS